MFAGIYWQPQYIERVNAIKNTSTKPLHVVTDNGSALMKYIGNPAGPDALMSELIGCELANLIGLETPNFAIARVPEFILTDPPIAVEAGPAFFSKWEQSMSLSPNSLILKNLRNLDTLPLLVIFDTWIRNKDRFCIDYDGQYENNNFDNILFVPDKRKTKLLVIDHTHAFVETSFDYELDNEWVLEREIFGLFGEFKPFLNRKNIQSALGSIGRIDAEAIKSICESVPAEWGMTSGLAKRLADCLVARGKDMQDWVLNRLLDQFELNLEEKEG